MDLHDNKGIVFLANYAAGQLTAEDHLKVRQHLKTCGECRKKVDAMVLKFLEHPEPFIHFLQDRLHAGITVKDDCGKVNQILSSAACDALTQKDRTFVLSHIKDSNCSDCLDRYYAALQNKEQEETRQKKMFVMELKEIHDFLKEAKTLAGSAGISSAARKTPPLHVSKMGIDYNFRVTPRGNLTAHLRSDSLDVSELVFDLRLEKEGGGESEIISRKIPRKGNLKLGSINDLPEAGAGDTYAAVIVKKRKK